LKTKILNLANLNTSVGRESVAILASLSDADKQIFKKAD